MVRVAVYGRISKLEVGQEAAEQLENQLMALRSYAAARNWTIFKEYTDIVSGAKDNRPALTEMMKAVRARWVDVVCVVRIDRLGRSILHLLTTIEEMESYGVKFVAVEQAIDTDTAMGRFLLQILAAVAAFERELIVERTKAGLARARRSGKKLGRHPLNCPCGITPKDKRGRKIGPKHDGTQDQENPPVVSLSLIDKKQEA